MTLESLKSWISSLKTLFPLKALLKTTKHNIPQKKLKWSSEASVNVLHRLFNETATKSVFLDNLKFVDATPVWSFR